MEPTPSETPAEQAQPSTWPERVAVERERLTRQGRAAMDAAKLLLPFGKVTTYNDFKKLRALLAKTQAKLEGHDAGAGGRALLAELEEWIALAPEQARRETAVRLRDACEAMGIDLKVERRDPPVLLRVPPFGVEIDFAAGKSKILFARLPVAECGADAGQILAARQTVMDQWNGSFDGAEFHDACRKAWRAARAAEGSESERVEILTFLPYLALQRQSEKFAIDPHGKTFRAYGRARFAYDVNLLRERRELDRSGYRLCLGVATGSTAQQKKRVIYFEDGHGAGEFKLTIYFTRSEVTE